MATCGSGASGREVELSAETLFDETGCVEVVCAWHNGPIGSSRDNAKQRHPPGFKCITGIVTVQGCWSRIMQPLAGGYHSLTLLDEKLTKA